VADGAEAEAPAPEASEGTNAIAGVEREVTEAIAPDNVADALSGYEESDEGSGMGDWNVPEEGLTAQAMHIQRDNTPQEPAPTREAKVGDVIKAIKPYLKPALDWLEENVVKTLKKIEAGEAVISIVVIAPIIVAPLTQKEPRNLALDQLDGTDITFGKIPNFKLEPKINNGQVTGGVITYDLAPALRKAGIPW